MTDIRENPAPLQAEPASPSEVAGLNARTARRQRLLLGGVGALALAGGSWFILGGDDSKTAEDAQAAQTIDTAGLVNRDLSQREFVASYGNRLDAVTREQKALKETAAPRSEVEAQLAALKAENQAMRVDGQAAIDAISAENADLKSRLAATPVLALGPPDDVLMRALFERQFMKRGLDARPDLIDWLIARVERSHIAVIRAVDVLDQHVLERRKRLSIPLARATLAEAGLIAESRQNG